MNLEQLKAEHPALVAALLAEGAAAERQRMTDVEAQALVGHEKLIAQLKADGVTTGPMAAVAVLAAERAVAAGRASAIAADAPKAVAHAAAPADVIDADADTSHLSLDERCKAKWDKSPRLRAEYRDQFTNYLAYERANAAGKVKVLGGNK